MWCIAAFTRYNGVVKRQHIALAALIMGLFPVVGVAALESPVAIRPTLGVVVESLLDPSLAGFTFVL